MKLSIVIVNYNVKYFLSNCLLSVFKALEGIESEVFVVDNNSTDQSIEMVESQFPQAITIANKFNAGFSKANNQAIELAKGEYIILLNPDTVVEEDCFIRCIEYMDAHQEAGGMGIKMIDGAGRFLPESKRGLPTPSVAFYKIFGLSRLFPRSKRFGKYHLGYIGENETSEIEVMSGAFMLLRKKVTDIIGGLDEAFFMYGEDIDMSYRIIKAGYKNIYFPEARIIHFKGESTKKSSVNYVMVFYRAMIIFARKHFSQQNARTFSLLINLAIYLRATMALLSRFMGRIYMPLMDTTLLWLLLLLIKESYEGYVLGENYYPEEIEFLAFPLLIACWILGQFLLGGYHQPVKLKNVFKGLLIGALLVFVSYAMLDESMRFSRAIVAISVISTLLLIPLSRIILMKLGLFRLIRFTEKNSAIVGSPSEAEKVRKILSESPEKKKRLFFISPWKQSQSPSESLNYTGSLYQIDDAIKIYDIDELIFCLKDVRAGELIDVMQKTSVRKCSIVLHPESGDYLLKSSSTQSAGEFILPELNPLMSAWSIRKKSFFEKTFALSMIVLSPFLVFIYRNPLQFLKNMSSVLFGRKNLIGFKGMSKGKAYILEAFDQENSGQEFAKQKIDYLMNYGTEKDLEIALIKLNQLDRISIQ